MGQPDSNRAYRQWRVEHARNPEKESTPQSAAADAAGETLLSQELGHAALQRVKENSSALALKLTRRPGTLETFGSILLELVDPDKIPSRMEIHQTLVNKGTIESDALVTDQIEERRRQLLLDQIGEREITAIAVTLCQGEREGYSQRIPISVIIEESRESSIVDKAEEIVQ